MKCKRGPWAKSVFYVSFLVMAIISSWEVRAEFYPLAEPDKIDSDVSLGDQLDNLGLIYKSKENPALQELWLLGRYHGQYYWSDGSAIENDEEGFETRRLRLGAQAKVFNDFTFHAQMVSGSDASPFYNGFTELWGQWKYSSSVILTLGQQKHRFTHDRNVSSRYINYLERSMLTNMFAADYTPAVTLQGAIDNLSYYSGFFTNATGRNMGDSFTELDSGFSYLASGYYDLEHPGKLDSAYLYAAYLHSEAKNNATNLDRFDDGLAAAIILTEGPISLVSELTAGINSTDGNAVGLNLQPSYFLTDNTQIALRYQLASSNKEQGLEAQRRYESESGLSTGDLYNAAYLGLNYYIARHRLKLMGGLEYSTLGGEQVWTSSLMVRFFFGPHSGGPFPMNQMLPGQFFEYD